MALDTVMKVSAKKAKEMVLSMYPSAKARRATDEETEWVVGKEIVASYNLLDGKLNYKFKKSEVKESNIERTLRILTEKSTGSDVFDAAIEEIKDLTDNNDHKEAYLKGTKILQVYASLEKNPKEKELLTKLSKNYKDPNTRDYKSLFAVANSVLTPSEYKKFNAVY